MTSWWTALASRPRTSSSIRTSSPSPPASMSTTTTVSTSSRRCAGSGRTCRMRMSPAACRIFPSRSAATSRCARRCTRCSSITPSRPAWTWASSMPASWRSMTIETRIARGVRGRHPQPPPRRDRAPARACRKLSRPTAAKKEADLAWRELAGGEAPGACPGHGITDSIEADTEEARLQAPGRST